MRFWWYLGSRALPGRKLYTKSAFFKIEKGIENMTRVLILGGGFGGLAVAHRLLQEASANLEILLIDKEDTFTVGFRKTWTLLGINPEEGTGRRSNLDKKGIRRIKGKITSLDVQSKTVEVDGEKLAGDFLVVAMGVELAAELIPGFQSFAHSVYDRHSVPRAAHALQQFSGGKIVVGIFGNPYQCPPGPYEIALLVNEQLKTRQLKAEVSVFTPLPMSLPILGSVGCEVIEGRLASAGIKFFPNHVAQAVEKDAVVFSDGKRLPFDLLLGVAPHRAPQVVRQSGLTEGGDWVPVSSETLETRFPGVYAIGDVNQVKMANGKPLPKAGVFAEGEGIVVAERILAILAGKPPAAVFEGTGGCYLEFGGGTAAMVEGHFLARPEPIVNLSDSSTQYLDQKRQFERDHLSKWFG
jgi:sulfide:quinone oxidoreductase